MSVGLNCTANDETAVGGGGGGGVGGPDWQRPGPLGHPAEPFVYIPLSTLNALLSVFSALFFLVRDKAMHPLLRRLVVTMSVFEILFHLSVIAAYANQLSQSASARQEAAVTGSPPRLLALQALLRFSLTMRNWTMGLISWSRLEAVCRPVASRSFKPAHIVAMETAAAIVGLALSVLMVTAQDARLSRAHWTQAEVHAIEVVFYTYQGMAPILSILLATVITVAVLRRAGHLRRRLCSQRMRQMEQQQQQQQEDDDALGQDEVASDEDEAQSRNAGRQELQLQDLQRLRRRRRNRCRRQAKREKRSIQLIVALSLTCLVLESPTDVCGFIKNKAPLTELIVNTLVELDSLCNFFIYTCTTAILRQFCCASAARARRRAPPDGLASAPAPGAGSTTYQRSPQELSDTADPVGSGRQD